MSKVQVAVRLRPFNRREKDSGKDILCVEMQGTQTILDGAMHKHGKQQVKFRIFLWYKFEYNLDVLLCATCTWGWERFGHLAVMIMLGVWCVVFVPFAANRECIVSL